MTLNAMMCVRRSGLRHDLSASHRERDVLLRQVPVAGHRDRRVRFRTGHVHLLAAGRSPGEGLRLEGHRRRHIWPGDAVHGVRHAVPAADRYRGRRRQRRRRQAGVDQRGRGHHGRAEHHRTAGGREPAAAQQRRLRQRGRGHPVVRPPAQLGRRRRVARRRPRPGRDVARHAAAAVGRQAVRQGVDRGRDQGGGRRDGRVVRQRSGQAVAVHAQPARADRRVRRPAQLSAQQPAAERGVLRQPEPETVRERRQHRRYHVPEGHILQR